MSLARKAGLYIWHTIVCLAALALILALYWAVAYSFSVYHRRQAERVLQQLAALQPGRTNPRSAQQIAKDFGGKESCFEEICRYDFGNLLLFGDSWRLMRFVGRTEWDHFGLRPWQVSVVIRKEGKEPAAADVDVAVGWNRGFGMWSWRVVGIYTLSAEKFERFSVDVDVYPVTGAERQARLTQDRDYGVVITRPSLDTPGGGEALAVYLSSSAPAPSRHAAFDSNLRCATARKACTDIFQFVPSLRPYYDRTYKNQ